MKKIIIFIPDSHLSLVKDALFSAGAGHLGNYDSCSFEIKGTGQFRPLKGSEAFIGEVNELCQVPETRLELACSDSNLRQVLKALITAHPYEVPAYDVIELFDVTDLLELT